MLFITQCDSPALWQTYLYDFDIINKKGVLICQKYLFFLLTITVMLIVIYICFVGSFSTSVDDEIKEGTIRQSVAKININKKKKKGNNNNPGGGPYIPYYPLGKKKDNSEGRPYKGSFERQDKNEPSETSYNRIWKDTEQMASDFLNNKARKGNVFTKDKVWGEIAKMAGDFYEKNLKEK